MFEYDDNDNGNRGGGGGGYRNGGRRGDRDDSLMTEKVFGTPMRVESLPGTIAITQW